MGVLGGELTWGWLLACALHNRNEIRLDSFDAATNTIVADIGAVFAVRQALVE